MAVQGIGIQDKFFDYLSEWKLTCFCALCKLLKSFLIDSLDDISLIETSLSKCSYKPLQLYHGKRVKFLAKTLDELVEHHSSWAASIQNVQEVKEIILAHTEFREHGSMSVDKLADDCRLDFIRDR